MLQTITSGDIVAACIFLLAQGGGIIWGVFKWVMSVLEKRDALIERRFEGMGDDFEHKLSSQNIQSAAQSLRIEQANATMAEFKLEAARTFVTLPSLSAVESRLMERLKDNATAINERLEDIKQAIVAVSGTRRSD